MHKITRRIPVEITKHSYEIVIGRGSLQLIGEELLKAGFKKGIKVLIVTNKDVADPYSEILLKSLKENGFNVRLLVIEAGEDPNVSVVSAIFQSFGDAPGGIQEEWRELMYSVGFEYWYNNQFAFRGGYFHEHETKGNRKYFSFTHRRSF